MTCKELIQAYYAGHSGTGFKQFLNIRLIDSDGEVIFMEMRAEAFLRLVSPDLELESFQVEIGEPRTIRYGKHKRTPVLITVFADINRDVPDYYSDEEWEALKAGNLHRS